MGEKKENLMDSSCKTTTDEDEDIRIDVEADEDSDSTVDDVAMSPRTECSTSSSVAATPPANCRTAVDIDDDDDDDDVDVDDNNGRSRTAHRRRAIVTTDDDYYKPLKRLRMSVEPVRNKPLTPFSISDILNFPVERSGIVRPWDDSRRNRRPRSADDDDETHSEKSESDSPDSPHNGGANNGQNSSPLDALFEMTSKAFDGLHSGENPADAARDHLQMYTSRQQPKKKRKSRTAFTNHQIFELEKRFLYQKYLSPADRDEIAQSLGLTNAQVITWFQNRRAKLKRDVEELKKDVDAAQSNPHQIHKTFLEKIQDLSLLKSDVMQNCT